MRYALISDIHGNFAALKQVLQFIETQNCDQIVCLGDIVGYGPEPNNCCERIKKVADISIVGNHDDAAIGNMDLSYFNRYARRAIEWTQMQLQPASRKFLAQCPLRAQIKDALCVHASPFEPGQWHYVVDRISALKAFRSFHEPLCFIGHSHVPMFAVEHGDEIYIKTEKSIDLQNDSRYIINVGSVGQPRDGDPKACVGIYDSEEQTYRLNRLAYDINATQEKMRLKRLPEFLINRLSVGH